MLTIFFFDVEVQTHFFLIFQFQTGQIERSFKVRNMEHSKSFIQEKTNFPYAKHFLEGNHILVKNIEILNVGENFQSTYK